MRSLKRGHGRLTRPALRAPTTWLLAWLALGAAGSACTHDVPTARVVRIQVTDDDARPLAGVPIELDGISATKTGTDGSARISLAPTGPARARIGVACPTGSREVAPRHVLRALAGDAARLELTFLCRPALRTLAVVLRAPGGAGLWLRADGEPLGRVAADGTLHATLERAPESELRLLLDTGDRPVSPRNPVHQVRVADRDELVVFDQPLSTQKPHRSAMAPARQEPSALPPDSAEAQPPHAVDGHER